MHPLSVCTILCWNSSVHSQMRCLYIISRIPFFWWNTYQMVCSAHFHTETVFILVDLQPSSSRVLNIRRTSHHHSSPPQKRWEWVEQNHSDLPLSTEQWQINDSGIPDTLLAATSMSLLQAGPLCDLIPRIPNQCSRELGLFIPVLSKHKTLCWFVWYKHVHLLKTKRSPKIRT